MIESEIPATPVTVARTRGIAPEEPPHRTPPPDRSERGIRRAGRAGLGESAGVLLVYVLLTIALTYPMAFTLVGSVLGPPKGDQFFSLWQLWFPAHAIFELGISPLVDPSIYAPFGYNLVRNGDMAPATIFPLMPLTYLLGEVLTHNLFILATFVLTGFGTHALARELGANRAGAFLAGILVAYSQFRFIHAGHLTIVATQWIPFFFLYLERTICRPTLRHGFLTGLFYALVALSTWYYAGFAAVAALLYAAARIRWWAEWRRRGPLVRAGAAAVVTALVLMSPFLVLYAREVTSGTMSARLREESQAFSASLADFIIPSAFHPLWGRWVVETWRSGANGAWLSEWSVGLSIVALPLALVAVLARRHAAIAALVVVAVGTAILSLGPSLYVMHPPSLPGAPNLLPLSPIPLPMRLLDSVPPFSLLRAYSRMAMFTSLAVGVLAGLGLTLLLRRIEGRAASAGVAGLVLALAIGEGLAVPWPVTSVEPRPIESWLAEQPDVFTFTEYPIAGHGFGAQAMYSTRLTGKRIVLGHSSYPPIMQYWAALGAFPAPASLEVLEKLDVRYVLVDETLYRAGVDSGSGARQTWGTLQPAIQASGRLREVTVRGGVHAYELLPTADESIATRPPPTLELLQNGDFEDSTSARAVGWIASGSPTYEQSGAQARSGRAAVALGAGEAISSTVIAIDPGACYHLRVSARTDQPDSTLRLQINAFEEGQDGAASPTVWSRVIPVGAGSDWQEIEDTYRAPPDGPLASVSAVVQTGGAWVDDFSLQPSSEPCDRPRLVARPNPIPPGSTTTTLSWNAGDDSDGQLWLAKDDQEILVSDTGTGRARIPWIVPGHTYEFRLYPRSGPRVPLATVAVEPSPSGEVGR